MTENGKPRIPPFVEDTLSLLIETAGGTGEDLDKEEAKVAITTDERFNAAAAEEALAQLESRGYIYFVGENIRVTPTDD